MAATTIGRATITDSSGTPGTGTKLTAAFFGAAIYDKVDALFTNSQRIEASVNSALAMTIVNTNSGTAALSGINIGNNDSASMFAIQTFSSGYTTSGSAIASSSRLLAFGEGGLSVISGHPSAPLRFYTANNERARFLAAGHLVLQELSANPGTSDLAANAAVAVYTKADKLVFAYNNGGTMTYITLDLDGSDTSLTHSTSAP
jgi:hypothetical protein